MSLEHHSAARIVGPRLELPPPCRSFDNLRAATASSGHPIISFTSSPTGAVLRFDGARWRNLGGWGLVGPPYNGWRYITADMDLAVGADDTVYVVFVDGSELQRGTCLAFRNSTAGGAWTVGGAGIRCGGMQACHSG